MISFINAFVFVITFGLVQQVVISDNAAEPTVVQQRVEVTPHWSDDILNAAREAGRLP